MVARAQQSSILCVWAATLRVRALCCISPHAPARWLQAPKSAAREKQKRHKRRRMSDAGADGDVSRTRSGSRSRLCSPWRRMCTLTCACRGGTGHRTRSTRRGGGELFKLPEDVRGLHVPKVVQCAFASRVTVVVVVVVWVAVEAPESDTTRSVLGCVAD